VGGATFARRYVVTVAFVALALGACANQADDNPLAGDGGEDADQPTEAPPVPEDVEQSLEDAIEATWSVSSADFRVEVGLHSELADFSAAVDGEFDREDVGTGFVTSEGDGDSGETELRSDGETVWVRSNDPDVTAELPAGVSWVEASVDDMRGTGVFTGLDNTFGALYVLRGIDEVSDAGIEEIEGVPVRLLEGDVDWEAALAAADTEERDDLQDTITLAEDTEATAFVAMLGLDGDGRVRLLELDITVVPAGTDGEDLPPGVDEASLMYSVEVARFDHDVAVPGTPPEDQTVPMAEVPEILDALTLSGST